MTDQPPMETIGPDFPFNLIPSAPPNPSWDHFFPWTILPIWGNISSSDRFDRSNGRKASTGGPNRHTYESTTTMRMTNDDDMSKRETRNDELTLTPPSAPTLNLEHSPQKWSLILLMKPILPFHVWSTFQDRVVSEWGSSNFDKVG